MEYTAAGDSRDPYTFKNHDLLPKVPREALLGILKGWDDSSDANNSYLDYFQDDGVLLFGVEHKGKDAIRKARDSMIHKEKGPVLKSNHFCETGFVTGGGMGIDGKWEIIGVADVRYDMVDGSQVWTRAASWCRVVKGDDGWLVEKYEVLMDGSKLFEAIGKLGK